MDTILKSFSISFLLRSVVSGAFFSISYLVAKHGPLLSELEPTRLLSVGLPLALFAGVSVYGIHRSLIYPFIEFCLDTAPVKAFRKRCPLISIPTVRRLLLSWDRLAEDDKKKICERARQITAWADYAHLQYASSLCIALGALVGTLTIKGRHPPYAPLIVLAFLLLTAASVSDWRLRSLQDHMNDQ
jgi:hypothetical protein